MDHDVHPAHQCRYIVAKAEEAHPVLKPGSRDLAAQPGLGGVFAEQRAADNDELSAGNGANRRDGHVLPLPVRKSPEDSDKRHRRVQPGLAQKRLPKGRAPVWREAGGRDGVVDHHLGTALPRGTEGCRSRPGIGDMPPGAEVGRQNRRALAAVFALKMRMKTQRVARSMAANR